ncbi:hypothetical protein ACJMK2_005780 [Sinanodonta woodiana]|uniref:Macro domain-containing protein n=1 Tax=Sinanodonta woodiana TaxID=1069815 RepID=A0ABD3VR70_SINWO
MLPSTTLEKSFCADLIRHKAFNGAETLVRDTYKLQVEAKQSEKKFVITAVNIDILELAEELLKSWLERKKKGKGDSIDDKIKDTKDNYLLDISEGHVIWIFWGELGSKLLSEDWKKETEKLKFIGSASVSIKPMPKKKTCITCSFEYFEAVRKKVENLIQLVTSGISSLSSLDKSQRSESNDGSKGKDQTGTDGSKGKDQTGIDGSKGKDQTGTDGSKGKDQTGTDGSKGKDQTGTVSSNGKYLDGVGGSNGKDQTVSENSLKSDNNGSKGSGQTHSDKLKVTTSRDTGQTDPGTSGSEDKGSRGTKKQEMIAADHKGTSQWNMDQSKSETPTIEAEDSDADTASQSEGESRENKLPPLLRGKENGSTQMPLGSASKHEISEKDKYQLFCTENGKIKVYVYEASIVSLSGVDAIVNAANERLNHIGGVAYHISKASGGDKSALEIECHNFIEKNKKVRVTKNFTSSAGNMPYVGVIHAVGPMWSDYKAKDDCAKDLCMTIVNVLMEADKKKFLKIAVPAISSGIYGIPKRLCAEMYIRGVVDYDRQNPQTCVREIHFVDIAKDILKEIRDAYERWKQNDNNINFKNANSYRSGTHVYT